MPRVKTRLYVVLLPVLLAACNAPSNQRMTDRPTVGETGAFSGSLARAAAPASSPAHDSNSIKATVTAVTNDVIALRDAPPSVAAGKLPAHERLVTGMLDTFESRIRAMHVQADPAWTSVIDSVRTDLARLPTMPPASLAAFLPQHLNRVMRIVACIEMVKD